MLTRAVNEIVGLVESKEMARNAVPLTEDTSVSAIQRLHDADHRACRNTTPRRDPTNYLLGQNNRVVRSASDFISPTKKSGIPNLIHCVLNATRHRNTEDVTSLLKWILYHLNQGKNFRSHDVYGPPVAFGKSKQRAGLEAQAKQAQHAFVCST